MAETAQYLAHDLARETFGISIRKGCKILDVRPVSRMSSAAGAGPVAA